MMEAASKETPRFTDIPFTTMFGRHVGGVETTQCFGLMEAIADQLLAEGKAGVDHMDEYLARLAKVQYCRQCPLAQTCLGWRQRQAYMKAQEQGVGLGPLFGPAELYILKYG